MKLQFRKQCKLIWVIKHTFIVQPKAMMNNLKREDKVKIMFFLFRERQKKSFAGRQLGQQIYYLCGLLDVLSIVI